MVNSEEQKKVDATGQGLKLPWWLWLLAPVALFLIWKFGFADSEDVDKKMQRVREFKAAKAADKDLTNIDNVSAN